MKKIILQYASEPGKTIAFYKNSIRLLHSVFFVLALVLPSLVAATDTTPPVVTAPADITIEATGLMTLVNLGTGTSLDAVDGSLTPTAGYEPFFTDEQRFITDIDSFFTELGNSLVEPPVTQGASSTGSFSVGEHLVTWSVTDTAGNTGTAIQTINVQDTTVPTVNCTDVTKEATGPTTPASLTCLSSDAVGVASINFSPEEPYSVGSRTVTASAADRAGNTGQDTFTLTIIDTTPPVVMAPPNLDVFATAPNTPVIMGIGTAFDLVDEEIIPTSSSTSAFALGSHTITWSVTDTAGNRGTATQTITVTDTTRPVIALSGNNPVTVTNGLTYTDAGATATDIVDGNLTSSIVKGGSVNINLDGIYLVTYDVVDPSGNKAVQKTRRIIVGNPDTTAPVIALNGNQNITLAINAAYNDAGATASDNVDGDLTSSITTSGGSIDTSSGGTHFVTYDVSDAAGNSVRATRTVFVGSAGDSFMPATTFTWNTPTTGTFTFSQSLPGATVANKTYLAAGNRRSVDSSNYYSHGTEAGYQLTIGDWNGDGKTDILHLHPNSSPIYSWVGLSNGDGTYTFKNSLPGASVATNSYILDGWTGRRRGNGRQEGNKDDSLILTGDFNGDGLTDMLHMHHSIDPAKSWVALSNGDGTFNFCKCLPGSSTSTHSYRGKANANVKTGDWNGDGLTDLLYLHPDGTAAYSWVALSDGDGTFTFSESLPGARAVTKSYLTSANDNIMVGDWNGDGLTDLLHLHPDGTAAYSWVALSDGDGTFTFRESLPGARVVKNSYLSTSEDDITLGDWNGDGLTDLLHLHPDSNASHSWVALSKGDGTFIFSRSLPGASTANRSFIDTTHKQIVAGDFNGDGLTDILHLHPNGSASKSWRALSNGDGTFTFSNTTLPGAATTTNSFLDTTYKTVYSGDWNGDGLPDLLHLHPDANRTHSWVALANGSRPDLLASVSNGYGGSSHINYKSSTKFSHTKLPYTTSVVGSIVTNDGNGHVNTNVYKYAGGYHHSAEREFRGFAYAKVTGQPDGNGEQVISETWFHQGNDLAVDSNNPAAANGYLKGSIYRTQVSDGNGNLYINTETTFTADADGVAPFYTPPSSIVTDICDGNTCSIQTRSDFIYDIYGNITREIQHGDTSITRDNRTTVKTYSHNTTDWILGLPSSQIIYKGLDNTGTQVSKTDFYYDGSNTCDTASTNQTPTKGLLTRTVKWLDGSNDPETRLAYDSYGNAVCSRNANGHKTTMAYDSNGVFQTSFTDALGQSTSTEYYGVGGVVADNGLYGQVKKLTDPNGAVVSTIYDALGRLKTVTQPDGSLTAKSYYGLGTVNSQYVRVDTSPINLPAWTYFDGMGRQIKSLGTGPDSKLIASKVEYDARGKVSRASTPYFETGGTPLWSTSTYDPMGRVTKTVMPDGTKTLSCYDDNVSVNINANGRRARMIKDARGNVLVSQTYEGTYTACDTSEKTPYSTMTYVYDVMGNLIYTFDAKLNRTEMQYDSLSRKTFMHDPDMGEWTYEYDLMNNLIKQTDAKGQDTFYQYDAVNRQVQKDYHTKKTPGSGNVVYSFDGVASSNGKGRLTTVTDSSGSATFHYDKMGRTLRSDKMVDSTIYTTRTAYDALGRTAAIVYPDNSIVTYAYNGPELKNVREGIKTHVAYSGYNAQGQPAKVTYGNGVTTDYTYHATNFRLKTLQTLKNTTTLQNIGYSFDAGGNVTGITDSINGSQSFGIDDLGRLTSAQGAYGSLTYAYDKIGNMISNSRNGGTYSYNASRINSIRPHAVKTAGGNNYSYDANGNMVSGDGRSLTYDAENRPVRITKNSITTTFVYNGNGGRIKKTVGSTTTTYIAKHYVCEASGCSRFIFAGSKRIAEIKPVSGFASYYHPDHLSSTSIVTDKDGVLAQSLIYYPYGDTYQETGSANGTPYKYTGKELDDSTGLYFYSARYYDPKLGKFISADTIVSNPFDAEAFNRYSYARNNPILYNDPSGHTSRNSIRLRRRAPPRRPSWSSSFRFSSRPSRFNRNFRSKRGGWSSFFSRLGLNSDRGGTGFVSIDQSDGLGAFGGGISGAGGQGSAINHLVAGGMATGYFVKTANSLGAQMRGETSKGAFCSARVCQEIITELNKNVRAFSVNYKGKEWDAGLKTFFSLIIKDAKYVGYKKGLRGEYKRGGIIEITSYGAVSKAMIVEVYFHESWHGADKEDHAPTRWGRGYNKWHGEAMKQRDIFLNNSKYGNAWR